MFAIPLIAPEGENAISADRPSQGPAELIEGGRRPEGKELVAGVQAIGLKILQGRPVPGVRPRLRDQVDRAAELLSVFGRRNPFDYLNLLYRLDAQGLDVVERLKHRDVGRFGVSGRIGS